MAKLDQVCGPLGVPGSQGVANRVRRRSLLLKPEAGLTVQRRESAGLIRLEMHLEKFGKQVVVAVPVALVVQRYHEEVAPLQGFQACAAPGLARHGVAQRAAQPLQHGRVQQKLTNLFGLMVQHLFHQIIHDVAVVSGERLNERWKVLAPLHRQGRQLKARDPALGAVIQGHHARCRQIQVHHAVEKLGDFRQRKAQIGGAEFGELTLNPQPGQRQRRVFAGGDGQMKRRRKMFQQKRQGRADLRIVQNVVVVQHKVDGVRQGAEVIEEFGENGGQVGRGHRLKSSQDSAPDLRGHALERCDQVKGEPYRVVVALVQREPGGWSPAAPCPFTQQRRLPEACGGRDKRHVARAALPEPPEETGTVNKAVPGRWNMQFRGQNQSRLDPLPCSEAGRAGGW